MDRQPETKDEKTSSFEPPIADPPTWRVFLRRAIRSPGCISTVLFMVLAVVVAKWVESIGGPESLIERYGIAAATITVPIHAVISVSPLPGEMVVVAEGAAYGFWWAVPLGWLGWCLASAIEYGLVRRSAEDVDFEALFRRLPHRMRRLPVGNYAFLIAGRWVPFGFHIVNIAAGARRVPFHRFMIGAAIGSIPLAILFAAIGAGIRLL